MDELDRQFQIAVQKDDDQLRAKRQAKEAAAAAEKLKAQRARRQKRLQRILNSEGRGWERIF
jgi:hypothetical protein